MKILSMCSLYCIHTENNIAGENRLGFTVNFTLSIGHQCTVVGLLSMWNRQCLAGKEYIWATFSSVSETNGRRRK